MTSFWKSCLHNWKLLFVILYPLLLSPIPIFVNTLAGYSAYSIAIVAGLWLTEAVPSPIAGMVPIFLHPLLGIQSSESIVRIYFKDTAFVFLGGYLLSLAFEYCGLHKRVALKVMLWSGTSLSRLLFGIMMVTTFLSMWMFNAAAAALMVPIVSTILEELRQASYVATSESKRESITLARRRNSSIGRRFSTVSAPVLEDIEMTTKASIPEEPKASTSASESETKDNSPSQKTGLRTMFLLGISYSANIGGTGVLTGTGPNLIALDYLGNMDPVIHGDHAALTFTTWMMFALLPMVLNIAVAWVYLQLVFLGIPDSIKFWKKKPEVSPRDKLIQERIKITIQARMQEKYGELGAISCHEILVGIHFLFTALFWCFHNPKVVPGWSELFERKIHIATGTVLTGVLLFIIPRNPEFYNGIIKGRMTPEKLEPLLDWGFTLKGIPWGVFPLLGGGLALSAAAVSSGLSTSVVQSLHSLANYPNFAIQCAVLLIVVCLTELMSNTAVATLVIPILLELSLNLKLHPLFLTFPAAIACSYAFILPVATGPNLIVFTSSGMKLFDMVRAGVFMSLISISVLAICAHYYGDFLFHFSDYKLLK